MKKNKIWFVVCFAVVAVIVFGAAIGFRGRLAIAPGEGGMRGGIGADAAADGSANGMSPESAAPDSVATSPLADGDEVVADATVGYYFSMPTNWYVEKNTGARLVVYPDYDPKSGDTPDCKIEISTFAENNSADLNAWITNDLHADPTAQVSEISRTQVAIGEAAGASSSAIEWMGTLNGVTTTLVYAIEPNSSESGSENILQIAPSTLSEASDADNEDCDLDLQAFLANLNFGSYEP